jgi:hypothetical protein
LSRLGAIPARKHLATAVRLLVPQALYARHADKLANFLISRPLLANAPQRHDGPADMSSIKTTPLDRRLYAWLGESNDSKFDRAFQAYFSVAFPAVVRHLSRISRWDLTHLEELAQDALLRFFERVGRGRREAYEAVQQALARMQPMNFGPFHERQVSHWTHDIASFKDSAMRFRLAQDESEASDWKGAVRALADRIPLLQKRGCQIVQAVRVGLHWEGPDETPAEIALPDSDDRISAPLDESIDNDGTDRYAAAKFFADALITEVAAGTSRAKAALSHHPRLVEFVAAAATIIDCLPRLRIPTNGYLFEIAMTIHLDECKKRCRKKRGGSGVAEPLSMLTAATSSGETGPPHPIEIMSLESGSTYDGAEQFDELGSAACDTSAHSFSTPTVDPMLQIENEDLFEKFFEYLRKPVADATEAVANAQGSAQEKAARRKLASLISKFSRTTAVLALMGEGYTQERIADQLFLSRNQVKYIVELVKEAYARFAVESSRPARGSHLGVESNAS